MPQTRLTVKVLSCECGSAQTSADRDLQCHSLWGALLDWAGFSQTASSICVYLGTGGVAAEARCGPRTT